jgi:alpha-tubulin suppressor-like RCC1 family protein
MGANEFGQLGNGTTSDLDRPQEIVASNVVAITAGNAHSLFIKSDGSLWAMGLNQDGRLGDGTTNSESRPEQIVSNGVVAVAAGLYHSLFLKSDGSLWAMGWNEWGQLGDGTSGYMNYTNQPEKIISSGVMAIAAGDSHSLFLKSDGSLWGMGASYDGQLGDGFTNRLSWKASLPEQIVPSPQPVLTESISSVTDLQFQATCLFAGTFYLLTSTNLTQPLSQWTPVRTNSVTARGTNNFSAMLTNAVNSSARQFYILQSQ